MGSPAGAALKSIHVLRKPCSRSAPTVAANVLRHGTGGLNINTTRIAHSNPSDLDSHRKMVEAIKSRGGHMAHSWKNSSDLSGANDVSTAGRWPANLIFQHLDGCVQDGVKKVGSGNVKVSGTRTLRENPVYGVPNTTRNAPDNYGTETVTAWVCVQGCPVAALDAQNGFLVARGNKTSMGHGPGSGSGVTGWGKGRADAPPRPDLNDGGGGASRFFKQVGGRSE